MGTGVITTITIPFQKEFITDYYPHQNPQHPLLYKRQVVHLGPAPTPEHPHSQCFLYAPHPIFQELHTDQDYDTLAYLQDICKIVIENDKTYIYIDSNRYHT